MPCQSYDSSWDQHDSDRDKIKELKKQADMLARIACKALQELEDNKIEDMILLRDDEVRVWWQKHKEDDRRAREAREAKERRAAIKKAALAKLSEEEQELLGLKKTKRNSAPIPSFRIIIDDEDEE
jgi:hypothetical protein